jgi:glycosyltransferase involved in cell wall biosynthesis
MRVAMLLHKSIEHDSRVRRAARAAACDGHEVMVLHLPRRRGELDGELDGFEVRSVTPPAWVRHRLPPIIYRLVFLVAFVRAARRLRPDVVHAHDAAMLAPGWAATRLSGAALVYDAHEYAAGVPYRKRGWALFVTALERLLIRCCAAVITVSDGLADRLQARYGLPERPVVVRNLPDPAEHDPAFQAPDLREALGIDPDAPLVLHLGAVALDRGCETLVRAMAHLPEAHLLFLGADDGAYVDRLRDVAEQTGVDRRVHLCPSVPVGHVRAHVSQADVGVSLLEDSCENHRLALPNKAFEYLAAKIPVVASDLPELRALLEASEVGWLVDPADPESVAAGLRRSLAAGGSLDDALALAGERLAWSSEAGRLTRCIAGLSSPRPAKPRAAILVRNQVSYDARVLREAGVLADLGFEVRIIGAAHGRASGETIGGIPVRRVGAGLPPTRLPVGGRRRRAEGGAARTAPTAVVGGSREGAARRAYRWLVTVDWNRRVLGELRRFRPEICHCNDYNTMWVGVAAKLGLGSRVLYDSHELWPDRNLRPEWRPWLLACEAFFVRIADRVITTSPAYATRIAKRYRIRPPRVIRNIPDLTAVAPTLPNGSPTAVYFGAITSGRGLEEAIAALPEVPELRMRLIGPESWGFGEVLVRLAAELGVAERVALEAPVPPADAAGALRGADIGLALIQPVCESYRLTLPNKVFEYTLAGLPILATDLPAIDEFVSSRGLGLTVSPGDPRALVVALRSMLDPELHVRFAAAVEAAQDELSWRQESVSLAETYRATATGAP